MLKQTEMNAKFEHQIAATTAAGREALAIMHSISRSLSGSQKIAKAFELTEMSRQIMRAGIRASHPEASEAEVQRLYVDRLLSFHGTSIAELRALQQLHICKNKSDSEVG